MEDFSQLCHGLQREYKARNIPLSLRDYVRMCLESLADLISEGRPEQFHSAMARFFASLNAGNEMFNGLAVPTRENLNSITIGFPPRRLFELLNDLGRLINELSLAEMSSKTLRLAFEENGFPYRPNEMFSLIEQAGQLEARLWEPDKPERGATASGPSGQTQNNIPQPEDVAEFYRLQKLKSFEGKPKAELHRTIADSNAKKTGETLTDEERTREAERIKKAIRDYENKVARLK